MNDIQTTSNNGPDNSYVAQVIAPIMIGMLLMMLGNVVQASLWHLILQIAAAVLVVVGVYLLGKHVRANRR